MEEIKDCDLNEDVLEELNAIKAIYDEQLNISVVNEDVIVVTFTFSESRTVKFYLNDQYPLVCPSVKMNDKYLQNELEVVAQESVGMAMLCALITKAKDLLSEEEKTETASNSGELNDVKPCFENKSAKKNTKERKDKTKPLSDARKEEKKKPPMRTAMDVINRILWDESLQTDRFIVGYLDRFVGVQEKPFTSFSWENIASVDYTVLAIPKHRIQYFKYNNTKIWDKNERFDKVFGSTGHTETLADIIAQNHDENASMLSDGESLANSLQTQLLTEKKVSVKLDENEDNMKSYSQKDRPNFFLCLPISDDETRCCLEKVQEHVISCDERLAVGMVQKTAFHITLYMMRLENGNEKEKACKVLKQLEPILACMLPSRGSSLNVKGVSDFRGRVVYAQVEQNNIFQKFVNIAKSKFSDAGIRLVGNYEPYTPHITLLKLRRPMCRELEIEKISPYYYQAVPRTLLGQQNMDCLRLCSTSEERGADEFYVTISTIKNSLFCISEKLPTLICDYVTVLMSRGLVLEDVGDSYIADLLSSDVDIKEAGLCALEKMLDCLQCDSAKTLLIVRGLPGSGKTHLVKHLISANEDIPINYKICSADDYFHSKSNAYNFSGEEIAAAHKFCRDEFLKGVESSCDVIFVSNTHSQKWEYQIYQKLAILLGYKCHVIEIECGSQSERQNFMKRCVHNVRNQVHEEMFSRWESDMQSLLVDTDNPNISLGDIIGNSLKPIPTSLPVLYSALYLNEASKSLLCRHFPPCLEVESGDHMTISHAPTSDELRSLPVGKTVCVKVMQYVSNSHVQAVAVQELDSQLCLLDIPHVTISRSSDTPAKHAQQWLKTDATLQISEDIVLTGTVGVQLATSKTTSESCVDSSKLSWKKISSANMEDVREKPKERISPAKTNEENEDQDEVGLYFGPHTVKYIFVFDFDGTLFHTPGPVEGRRDYQRLLGVRWPYDGWLGRLGSLQYPLLVYPGPTLTDYFDYHERACSMSVLLTGRMEKLRPAVTNVFEENGLCFDRVMLKPSEKNNAKDRHYSRSVNSYKKDYVASLLKEFKDVDELIFWDDRADNIKHIRSLKNEFPKVNLRVLNVQESVPDLYKLAPDEMLHRLGRRPSGSYKHAVSEGLAFILKAWMHLMKTDVDQTKNMLVFGSYPLERRSDVDVCILAPRDKTVDFYIKSLGDVMESFGVQYISVALGIRCPRLKIKFHYVKASPVEFDVVIAPVLPNLKINTSDARTLYDNSQSEENKRVLEGILFFEEVVKPVEAKICLRDFGLLLDCTCLILSKNQLKYDAFRCVRTFHIGWLLSRFVEESSLNMNDLSIMKTFEKVLIAFLGYLSNVSLENWKRLFKKGVPDCYIKPLKDCFKQSCQSHCNILSLLFTAPHAGASYNDIQVQLLTEDSVMLWKAMTIAQAQLGGLIRKLTERGFEVYPGNVSSNAIAFSTSSLIGCRKYVEKYVKDLRNEFLSRVTINLSYNS